MLKILSKRKITFSSRLKELMQELSPPMTQDNLAKILKNPDNEGKPFNPHSISNWMNGGALRRNKDKIIPQLAKIFVIKKYIPK